MKEYLQRYDGEWVDVTEERSVACCDCGLVHREEHIIVGDSVVRRVWRDKKATADMRRRKTVRQRIRDLAKKFKVRK